jgi:hypothetical protein
VTTKRGPGTAKGNLPIWDAETESWIILPVNPLTTRKFLRQLGDGSVVTETAWARLVKQTEINFGVMPVAEAEFVVADADVSATSQLVGSVAYEAPTGKDLDELEMDHLDLKFAPGDGQLTIYAKGLDGYVADTFKVNYLIA